MAPRELLLMIQILHDNIRIYIHIYIQIDTYSEFTELAKSRFLDCDSCGMTQGAF